MVHPDQSKVRSRGAALVWITAADADRSKAALSPFNVHKNGRTTLSGSGVIWANSKGEVVVLTSAAAFQPFVNSTRSPARTAAELTSSANISVQVGSQALQGRCTAIIRVPAAARAAQQLLAARTVGGSGSFKWKLTPSGAEPADVSLVMVLSCSMSAVPSSNSLIPPAVSSLTTSPGAAITAVGCPFGATAPQHFADLHYNGVISQVIQDAGKPGLLLADFRVLPGMEGGPVYDSGGALAGMVATPLCITGYELPVVLPAAALRSAISATLLEGPSIRRQPASSAVATSQYPNVLCCPSHQQQAQLRHTEPAVQLECHACSAAAGAAVPPGVAPVVMGNGMPAQGAALLQTARGVVGCSLSSGQWASGILVNRWGTVLTNAHLFDTGSNASSIHITVTAQSDAGFQTHDAALVYLFTGALDVAILQVLQPPPGLQPLALSHGTPERGAGCYVAGHALFNPSSRFAPLLTHGNLAQVLRLPYTGQQCAVMLLTTAAVHSGASGGAVLSAEGQLLGMVTSNARHVSGQTVPHLNFSIASEWLQPLWQHLQQQPQLQEVGGLAAFDTAEEQLVHLWTLQTFVKQPDLVVSKL